MTDNDSTTPTNCSKCSIEKTDGIDCDECDQWFCSACIGQGIPDMFPDDLYAALTAKAEFPWLCQACSPDNILQQLTSNGTFAKEDLEAFGCNSVILGMIKADAPPRPDQPVNGAAETQGATAQEQPTSTDPMMQMMLQLQQSTMALMTTMAQNQKAEIEAIVDAVKPQNSPQSQSVPINQNQPSRIMANLPKLTLPTFDGDAVQWHAFWESFDINVHSQPIADRQKMDYLGQMLKGQAYNKIKGLGSDGSKYSEAIDILTSHYANPVFQKRAHWDNLHTLPVVKDNLTNLDRFNDDLRATVRAMQRCGINNDALDGYVPEVAKKLPSNVVIEMNKMRLLQDKATDNVTMEDLISFTQRYLQVVGMNNGKQGKKVDSNVPDAKQNVTSPARPVPTMNLNQNVRQRATHHNSTANSNYRQCVFCNGSSHYSDDCKKIVNLQARRKHLADANRCFNCLGLGHRFNDCKRKKSCFHCKDQRHHAALCPIRDTPHTGSQTNQMAGQFNETSHPEESDENEATVNVQVHLNQVDRTDGIVMPAFHCQVKNPETNKMDNLLVYADGGARRSCISQKAANVLGLKSKKSVSLVVGRFNSNKEDNVKADVVEATLCGPNGYKLDIRAYSVPTTAPPLKVGPIQLSRSSFNKVKQARPINAPPKQMTSQPIDVMLGQDYYNCIFGPHVKADNVQHQLYVYHTKLGNVLCGNANAGNSVPGTAQMLQNMTCAIQEDPIEQLWKLDAIGISGHDQQFSTKDAEVLRKFNETITKQDGRYEVGFPWKQQPCTLASNFHVAKQRLNSTVKSLVTNEANFTAYNDILQDQLKQGVIEMVEPRQRDGPITHYIAHFPVIRKDKSTTKVRIVYDPSVPTKPDKKCLNDLIHAGPCTLNDLTGILLRFRMGKIVMVADVEKAFLQVGLQLPDRDATRFLWLKDPNKPTTEDNIQVYRFARIPFGVIASPHLLGATVNFHLDQYHNALSAQLQRNIYVDNVIIRATNTAEAQSSYVEAKRMFQDAKMNLREWATNDEAAYQSITVEDRATGSEMKVLGMQWNTAKDQMAVAGSSLPMAPQSKRQVLGAVAKWFDPLGLVSPITIRPRVLIQKLWKLDMGWDDPLPETIRMEWSTCTKELEKIPSISFPRQAGASNPKRTMLIAFTDASQMAYATCIYLWQELDNGYGCNLVFSKARVTPLKPAMTIPKLELTAVLIGVRALRFVRSQLDITVDGMALWTDSQIVLHWMRSAKDLAPYVMRRKDEIQKNNDITLHYVETKSNPADLPTRGCTANQLQQSNWFNGPDWLQSNPENWPHWDGNIEMEVPPEVNRMSGGSDPEAKRKSAGSGPETERKSAGCDSEMGRKCTGTINQMTSNIQAETQPFGISNIQIPKRGLMSTLRVTAFVIRFVNKLKKIPQNPSHHVAKVLQTEEIQQATMHWLKSLQENHFAEEIKLTKAKKFNQLIKQLDLQLINGLLCCGGRLEKAFDNAFPILLPKNHEFTKLVVQDAHEKVFHYGTKATLAQLRQKYWIPQGYSLVRKILRPCTTCRRVQGHTFTAPRMAALPLERVQRAAAFKFTGLDYMGPLHVKEQGEYQKKWVAIFSCFTTRAIHLEVVEDCSTEALTQAMIRFIGRRGKPSQILSDNATQFKKGANVFKAILGNQIPENAMEELTTFFTSNQIQWKFIPESSPWVGGFYERMVGVVKRALKKVLWKTAINTTTLQTILIQLEGVINTRPLLTPTQDPAEKPLCPADFIGPSTQLAIPPNDDDQNDPEYLPDTDIKKSLLRQWQNIDKKLNSFWKIWQLQYLQELRETHQIFHRSQHGSVNRQPVIGEVCLIKEATPRATWKMGRIQSLINGADGEIRFVNILLPTKHVTRRGVKDLVPLEAEFQMNEPKPDANLNPRPGEDVEGDRHGK